MTRFFGAILLVLAGGSAGILLCRNLKWEEKQLSCFSWILSWMEDQLRFRLTPLPELLLGAADEIEGELKILFQETGALLAENRLSDCRECFLYVLGQHPQITKDLRTLLEMLAARLGQFDLPGQVNQLSLLREECNRRLSNLHRDNPGKRKICQTLGFCAGGALAILLL